MYWGSIEVPICVCLLNITAIGCVLGPELYDYQNRSPAESDQKTWLRNQLLSYEACHSQKNEMYGF
jgi:hypothetical protein